MSLLKISDRGIYCEQADVYIDPWKPVERALITHAHADHSRKGHQKYMSHHDSVPIIKHRLGGVEIQGVEYGEQTKINGVTFSFHPAGHIIGSAQIRAEYKGEIAVASGDYKTENDGISGEIEAVKCHTFITESTFGLPVFRWQNQNLVYEEINQWWRKNKSEGKLSVISAYSLGKAQRLIQNLDHNIATIYTHGAIEAINKLFRKHGYNLPDTVHLGGNGKLKEEEGGLVIAPPASIGTMWMKKYKTAQIASASGWMAMRGTRRRRGVDKGFVLSDHADWDGLNTIIKETEAENVVVTHGYTDIFARHLHEMGLNAYTAETEYTGETLEPEKTEEKTEDEAV